MSQYPEERSWRGDLAAFGARLKKSLSRNWGLKLTSLIIAVAVWGGLISQDASLTREKSFSDVAGQHCQRRRCSAAASLSSQTSAS